MRITNRHGLPEAFVKAVSSGDRSPRPGVYHVTDLIGPPRKGVLHERHFEDLSSDAADRLWALFGQVVHRVIEDHGGDDSEVTLEVPYGEFTVSGTLDLVGETIKDFKTTSVWSLIYKSRLDDWSEQLNIYACLVRKSIAMGVEGLVEPKGLQVIALLRDWQEGRAAASKDYPEHPIMTIDLPLWPEEDAEAFLVSRLRMRLDAELDLPLCTDEERWLRDEKWAVMREGRKSAIKLLESKCDADQYVESMLTAGAKVDKISIIHRPGDSIRCRSYCAAIAFCDQGQAALSDEGHPWSDPDDESESTE